MKNKVKDHLYRDDGSVSPEKAMFTRLEKAENKVNQTVVIDKKKKKAKKRALY